MRALSTPVERHCATNRDCDERATSTVMTSVRGIVTSAMTASNGEIQNMIAITPITVSND